MENTLLYFFSSIAQGYAALSALLFAAAQTRIAWLDNNLTQKKLSLVLDVFGQPIDYHMAKFTVTEVITRAKAVGNAQSKEKAKELKENLEAIVLFRTKTKVMMLHTLGMTFTGFIGLAFNPFINKSELLSKVLIGTVLLGIAWSLYLIGLYILNSLTVKKKVDD